MATVDYNGNTYRSIKQVPRQPGITYFAVIKKKLLSIGIFIPVLFILVGCGESLTPQEEARKYFDVKVKSKCQEAVTSRLRSPSTAEFPYWSEWGMVGAYDDDEAVTWSYVDAQNAFGGTVRQRFSCTFKKQDGTWKLVDVNF